MQKYYSKSLNGFCNDDVHGARQISIPDPSWVRPNKTIPDPAWQRPMVSATVLEGGKPVQIMVADTTSVQPTITFPDPSAVQPTIKITNPDCKLPSDAVAITDVVYNLLFEAQHNGQVITADAGGNPVATASVPPPPDFKRLSMAALSKSDTTIIRCSENGVGIPAAWVAYRQELRAIISGENVVTAMPAQPTFPPGT
jgi:hypothetical protein